MANQSNKSKVWRAALFVAALGMVVVIGFRWRWRAMGVQPSEDIPARDSSILKLVNSSVNLGDTPEALYLFLDAHHLSHTRLGQIAIRIGGHDYGSETSVMSAYRDSFASSPVANDTLVMIFVFDDDHYKLKRIDCIPMQTGL